MLVYLELIDDLAEKIYLTTNIGELTQFNLGRISAYKDLRQELLNKMELEMCKINLDAKD